MRFVPLLAISPSSSSSQFALSQFSQSQLQRTCRLVAKIRFFSFPFVLSMIICMGWTGFLFEPFVYAQRNFHSLDRFKRTILPILRFGSRFHYDPTECEFSVGSSTVGHLRNVKSSDLTRLHAILTTLLRNLSCLHYKVKKAFKMLLAIKITF